jgi:hypothetical protein
MQYAGPSGPILVQKKKEDPIHTWCASHHQPNQNHYRRIPKSEGSLVLQINQSAGITSKL